LSAKINAFSSVNSCSRQKRMITTQAENMLHLKLSEYSSYGMNWKFLNMRWDYSVVGAGVGGTGVCVGGIGVVGTGVGGFGVLVGRLGGFVGMGVLVGRDAGLVRTGVCVRVGVLVKLFPPDGEVGVK
jgi:hypothetical protein